MADHTRLSATPAPPPGVAFILRGFDRAASLGGYAAASLLMALTTIIIMEIFLGILNKIFPSLPANLSNTWEYSAYLMGAAFMLGTGQAMRAGAHIRMTVLLERAAPKWQRFLEIVSSSAALVLCSGLSWALIKFAWRAALRGQTSESFTPLWIPMGAMATGAVILTLQVLARLLRALFDMPLEDRGLRSQAATE